MRLNISDAFCALKSLKSAVLFSNSKILFGTCTSKFLHMAYDTIIPEERLRNANKMFFISVFSMKPSLQSITCVSVENKCAQLSGIYSMFLRSINRDWYSFSNVAGPLDKCF